MSLTREVMNELVYDFDLGDATIWNLLYVGLAGNLEGG